MSYFHTLPDLRQIETQALSADLPLMERAGHAAAEMALRWQPEVNRVLIMIGPGNNGGDGQVCARHLRNAGLDVICCSGDDTPDFFRTDLIIDALFGIGLSRAPNSRAQSLIEAANASGKPILALDTPSGLDAFTGTVRGCAIRATRTLTFIADKPGLHTGEGTDHAGAVSVDTLELEIRSFPAARGELIDAPPIALQSLRRSANTHKGNFGSVAIFGGATGMLGAPLLAGRAALKLGVGKICLGFMVDNYPAVDLLQPELMLQSAASLLAAAGITHIAAGPGLGQSTTAIELLQQIIARPQPLVLDADALNLIALHHDLQALLRARPEPAILTPHPSEAARLLDCDTRTVQADRIAAVRALAQQLNAIVLLKGAGSICSDGKKWSINGSGNAALSNAGQGDALVGMLIALLAQGLSGFEAARCAAWLHGAAADEWVKTHPGGIGLTASEVIDLARNQLNRLLN